MAEAEANVHRPSFGRYVLCALIGAVVAVAAFAQSVATIGVDIPAFRSAGPAFYAWRADLVRYERRTLQEQAPRIGARVARPAANTMVSPAAARRIAGFARGVVASEPLATSAWRILALAQAGRDSAQVRAIFAAADQLTRRDPAVQVWLLEDSIRREEVASTLRHFDALLRTQPEAHERLLGQLSIVIGSAEARRDLLPYMRADNPWFHAFNAAAVARPGSIIPYAQLMQQVRILPDSPNQRSTYAVAVSRLVREGQFDRLRRLYPRLPGADPQMMSRISLTDSDAPPYPPIGWALSEEPDRGATLVRSGSDQNAGALEAFADPVVSGVVARRLIWPPPRARVIRWRVTDFEGSRDATAALRLRCLDAVVESDNLLARGAASSLAIPAVCPVAMLELSVYGGTGRDAANLIIERLAFDNAAVSEGHTNP